MFCKMVPSKRNRYGKPEPLRQAPETPKLERCLLEGCRSEGRQVEVPVCPTHWDELDEQVRKVVWDNFWPKRRMARDVRAYVVKALEQV